MSDTNQEPWILKYLTAGLIWGGSFLFISVALESLPPIGVAFWRCALGAVAMLITALVMRSKFPNTWLAWRRLWLGGVFMSAIPFSLFSFAQMHVSSALAGIINAVTPMTTILAILIAFRAEKPKRHVIFGLVIGLIGVLVVLGAWQGFGDNNPLAVLALLLAVSCYGVGTPYVRKYIEPLKLSTEVSVFGQIGTAALTLLPLYLIGPLFISTPTLPVIASVIAVGALGSGFAYLLFYRVIATVGSAVGSSVTYITPIIAVALGVLLLNEELHWYEPVGGAVVILGAAISQGAILGIFRKRVRVA